MSNGFCILCGKKAREGWWNYCTEHFSFRLGVHPSEIRKRFCVDCGKELQPSVRKNGIVSVGNRKCCPSCQPLRLRAYEEYIKNLNKLNVLYECPCSSSKKINHHFDYSRPLDVHKLCRSCHAKKHPRPNKKSTHSENIRQPKSSIPFGG
jgi:hypothetical protein